MHGAHLCRVLLLRCSPETAEYTCYHLEASFGILNDYCELSAYPQLAEGGVNGQPLPVLKIVPELYDERASRLHVRRLRELLVKPPAHIQPSATQAGYEDVVAAEEDAKALATTSKSKKGGKKTSKKESDDPFAEFTASSTPGSSLVAFTDNFSLHAFHAASRVRAAEQAQSSLVDTVRNLSFSGWNPPPGNRALQGDLLYLEITTHEGVQVHVTANQEGFFVNQSTSTHFNPERAEPNYKSLTLVELLKKLSPLFKNKYLQVRTHACDCTRTPTLLLEKPRVSELPRTRGGHKGARIKANIRVHALCARTLCSLFFSFAFCVR